MPDYDPKTDIHVTAGPPSGGGGLYFIVGALVVAVLVGAYFMFGAPALHSNVPARPIATSTSPSSSRAPRLSRRRPARSGAAAAPAVII